MDYGSVFAKGLFAGKVVLVTGGGSGIGRCVSHELAALGAQVVLVGRKLEKLQAVAQEIEQDGGAVSIHVCDIRDEEAVKQTVAMVVAAQGHIDGLVNNAGGQYLMPLEAISAKGWEAVLATNLTGGFLMARECYLQSMSKHGGAIVNMAADIWGSMPGMGHSGAARAGMISFTETAALEWAGKGVRVNAVAPGFITTPMVAAMPEKVLLGLQAKVPLGRLGTPQEIANVYAFLASDEASYINGAVIEVSGGMSL